MPKLFTSSNCCLVQGTKKLGSAIVVSINHITFMAGVGENDLIMNQAISTTKSSHSNFAELLGQVKSQNHLFKS